LTLAKSIDIQILVNARGTLLSALLLPNFSEFSFSESIMIFLRILLTINTKGKGRSNIIEAATPIQSQYSKFLKGIHEISSIISRLVFDKIDKGSIDNRYRRPIIDNYR
jgi:hypothetical protein